MKNFLLDLVKRLDKHDINSYAAQSAYFLMLAFFPFIILMILVLTTLGVDNINNIEKILRIFPDGTVNLIKDYLQYSTKISTSIFSPLLISTIFISSSAVGALIKAFNIANDYTETRGYLKTKSISILLIIGIVVVFTILFFLSAFGLNIANRITGYMKVADINGSFFNILVFLLNFIIYVAFIGAIYYVLPAKKVKFKKIIPGTLFAAPTLAIMTNFFGYIVQNFTKYSVVYGSLTSVVMLLIWLFVCSAILIIGEEINSMIIERKENK